MDEDLREHRLDAQADGLKLDEAAVAGIFAASDALAGQYRLRATLSDPAVPAKVRTQIARRLFTDRIPPAAVELVAQASASATESTGLEAEIERQGVRAVFQQSGAVGRVQEEIFRFARVLEGNSDLQATLTDPLIEVAARQRLVADLLASQAHPATVQLVQRSVQRRGRTLVKTLDDYVEVAAQIGRHTLARVTVAQPLNAEQLTKMRTQLTRIYGTSIDIQIDIDPEVLGGARIEIGDDLIDGTVQNRLNEARRLIG